MVLSSNKPMPPERAAALAATLGARSYEVQRLVAGRWVTESVTGDKEAAIAMAKTLHESGRAAAGVRVMAVQLTPGGEFSEITLYRAMPHEPAEPRIVARKMAIVESPIAEKPSIAREFSRLGDPRMPMPAAGSSNVILALKIAFGIGFALVAFEAILLLHR